MHSQPLLDLPPLLLDPLTISPSPPPPPQVPLHRRLCHHCSPPSVLVGFLPYDLSLQALEFIIGVWQRRRWDLWGAQVAGGGGVAMAVEGPHGAHQRVGPMEGPCGASWRQRTAQAARLPAVTPPPSGAHQAQPWYVSPYYYPWRSFFLRPPPHPPPPQSDSWCHVLATQWWQQRLFARAPPDCSDAFPSSRAHIEDLFFFHIFYLKNYRWAHIYIIFIGACSGTDTATPIPEVIGAPKLGASWKTDTYTRFPTSGYWVLSSSEYKS